MIVIAVASLLASVLGLVLAPVLAQVTVVPGRVLVPFVLVLASIGAFASTTLLFQVAIMMLMGGVGLVMRRYGYSLPAMIVGLVLGGTAEDNLVLTQKLYAWRFVERPLTDIIIAAIVLMIVLGVRRRLRARRAPRLARPSAGELAVGLAWITGLAWYVWEGTRYPSPANIAPVYLGGAALAVAAFQLVGAFVPSLRRATHGEGGDTSMLLIALPNQAAAGADAGQGADGASDDAGAAPASSATSPGVPSSAGGAPFPGAAAAGEPGTRPVATSYLAYEVGEAIADSDWVLTANTVSDWAKRLRDFDRPDRHPGISLGTATQIGISLGVALATPVAGRAYGRVPGNPAFSACRGSSLKTRDLMVTGTVFDGKRTRPMSM